MIDPKELVIELSDAPWEFKQEKLLSSKILTEVSSARETERSSCRKRRTYFCFLGRTV
jgi:hypothetical protein